MTEIQQSCVEDVEDAELEGDRPFNAGTARAALSYSGFRRVYAGSVASNIGSWMQTVVLGAYAYSLTNSPTFVSILGFAQLGPLLLISLIGGSLADRFNRKTLLILVSIEQAIFATALALVARNPDPSLALLVAFVFAIGVGQAVAGPTFSSVLPSLVERRDLTGAVSLTSVNMNLSRVLGAVLGPFVFVRFGVSWVFLANAVTYGFIILGVATVAIPRAMPNISGTTGLRRILSGFGIARQDPVVGRVLITVATFSFCSLVFITQMAVLATHNLGINEKSVQFGFLYGTFGLGAMCGALAIGTVLVGHDLGRIVRIGLLAFSFLLALLSLWRVPGPAYPTAFVLGVFYFAVITSLSTLLQQRLTDNNRGRVMALWIMAFGGTVPIGALVAGPIIEATSITAVMLFGSVAALGLAFYSRLDSFADLPLDESLGVASTTSTA